MSRPPEPAGEHHQRNAAVPSAGGQRASAATQPHHPPDRDPGPTLPAAGPNQRRPASQRQRITSRRRQVTPAAAAARRPPRLRIRTAPPAQPSRTRTGLLALLPEARASLLLFGFLIAKVLLVTRGDLTTALGVVNAAGVVAVAVGAALSLLPTAAALVLAVAVFLIVSKAWAPRPWTGDPVTVGTGALTIFAGLILTPWPLLLQSGLMGVVAAGIDIAATRWPPRQRGTQPTRRPRASSHSLGLAVAIIAPLLLSGITGPLGAMWLPREELTVHAPTPGTIVGYVLNDNAAWVPVLRSGSRKLVWVKADTIDQRQLCTHLPSRESTWQAIDRTWFHARMATLPPICHDASL